MNNISRRALCAALSLILCAGLASAQVISGSIVGTVSDPSGAAIPEAEINVRNTGTEAEITVKADSSGTYVVSNLQPGTYELLVSGGGFENLRVTGIGLLASQTVRQDVTLKIGAVGQSVQVQATPNLIHTDSSSIGGSLNSRQVSNLPLSMQSIDSLEGLVPGAQTQVKEQPLTGGARYWGGSYFTLNGVSEYDAGVGRGATSALGLENQPPPSSLQEFKVESVNANAEFRAIGTVMLVTKAGSNRFHGEAYEYLQNTALNANTLLLNAAGQPRSILRWNQFGANLGGPVWRDRVFFFANYSGFRRQQDRTAQFTFPSMAMRQGDFSALCSHYANSVCADPSGTQLYNPFTGSPFPNNRIPSNLIAPQAQALLKYLPTPTDAASAALPYAKPNYVGNVPLSYDRNSLDTRIDYRISNSDTIWGVVSRNTSPKTNTYLGYPAAYGNGANFADNTVNYSLSETHIFNAGMINELRLGYFDMNSIRSGQNSDFNPRTLFPQLTESPNRGLPTMNIAGYTGMFSDYGYLAANSHVPTQNLTDSLTYVRGRHTIKAGIDISRYRVYGASPNAPLGTFGFSGAWTGNSGWPGQPRSQGNAFADFLLGTADSSVTGQPGIEVVMTARNSEFYVQDTWQASPKLTLYYGVRYMYQTPWNFRDNTRSTLDLENNKLVLPQDSATPGFPGYGASLPLFQAYPFETTQSLGWSKNYAEPDKNNWAPRFGFAYRLHSGAASATVIRGGYGVFYNINPAAIGPRSEASNPPWTTQFAAGAASQSYVSQLPGKPGTPYLPDLTFQNPFPASSSQSNVSPNPTIYMTQRDFKNAVTQQWNLTLEHQFATNWMVRASYVGSQAHHVLWYNSDINVPAQQVPNTPIQAQRPWQPWSSILSTRSGAKQNFEQLQLEITKQFTSGFLMQAQYQWTRSLDNAPVSGGPQNWLYPDLDYGNSDFIRRQLLVVNYIYELPFGHGKRWAANTNNLINGVIGGWQISGITTYGAGLPFSVNFSVPGNYIGWWGGRADLVPGQPLYAGQNKDSHDAIGGVQWFNPAAFSAPKPWTWGNSARNLLFGPGYSNWDLSLSKEFSIPRLAEHSLQLRADFFDVANHFNLGNPSSTVAATQYGGAPIASTGKIYGGSGNRVVQLALRYQF